MSLNEERQWKRILGKSTIMLLQDKEKSKIFKVRVFADRITAENTFHLYMMMQLFERKGTVAGFLTYLFGAGIDYEIVEESVESNSVQKI